MHLYHIYSYSNVQYFFDRTDVPTYIVYYDGEFNNKEDIDRHVNRTCYYYHYDANDSNDANDTDRANDPRHVICPKLTPLSLRIKDKVSDYVGHFIIEDKYLECVYLVFNCLHGETVHERDRWYLRYKYPWYMDNSGDYHHRITLLLCNIFVEEYGCDLESAYSYGKDFMFSLQPTADECIRQIAYYIYDKTGCCDSLKNWNIASGLFKKLVK